MGRTRATSFLPRRGADARGVEDGNMTAVIRLAEGAVSDDELIRISDENPGWQIERADDGALLVSPTSTPGGAKSGIAFVQLYAYAQRAGGKAFDSSTGFKMPGGGVLSPDAAWVSAERMAPVVHETTFWRVTPEVVIEVASTSDSWPQVCAKIDAYASAGAVYAVAIDPASRDVYARGNPPAGLELDLDAIVDG